MVAWPIGKLHRLKYKRKWKCPRYMIHYAIETQKYDADIGKLLKRRLTQCGCTCAVAESPDGVTVTLADEQGIGSLAEALCMLLCRDLQYFELAHYTDALPLELTQKQAVLTGTLQWARENQRPQRVLEGLKEYLTQERTLNLEGYLQFRMRDCLREWQEGVERAAQEQLLRSEYNELMCALNALMAMEQPQLGELSLCINPDGSCTLTDDSDARIEYMDCSDEGILSLLIGMSPSFLTVYDLSGGAGRGLTETIRSVFAGRVRVFR